MLIPHSVGAAARLGVSPPEASRAAPAIRYAHRRRGPRVRRATTAKPSAARRAWYSSGLEARRGRAARPATSPIATPGARAGGEEQRRAGGRRGRGRPWEHRPLIAGAQVKKAVPGEDAVEALAKGQPAHVGYKPARVREAALAQRDHRGRGIDAGHAIARFDEGAGDRLARPATEVEHRPAARHEREEAVEPGPLEQLDARAASPTRGRGGHRVR